MNTKFRLTEKDYRYLFENSNDAMWVHDLEGNLVDANKAFARLHGVSVDDWSQIKVKEYLSKETLALSREIKRKLLNNEEFEQPYMQRFTTTDGRIRLYQVSTSPVIIDGEVKGFQHVGRDVTEEKRSEEMLLNIIDGSPVGIFVIDRQHIVTHWNTAMERLTGISRDAITGTDRHWSAFYQKKRVTMADLAVDDTSAKTISEIYHGRCRQSHLMENTLEAENFFAGTGENGKWLLFYACPIKDEFGMTVSAIEIVQDITGQKRLEENIRFYSQAIMKAQEDERKRIARELHDDSSSSMLYLIQRLDALETACPESNLKQDLENLRVQAVDALDSLRRCAQELRPRILDDLGLVAAIEWIAEDMEKSHGIETDVKTNGQERTLPQEHQLMLFRITQEALSNIRRHAKATKVRVTIDFGKEVSVTVTDNGKGFDLPERIENLASQGHLGIMGMSERVQLMHGNLDIQSKPGKGTKLTITVPATAE
ncbi:MAG: PAS domain S-box protein [Dehalococcoidales bacterium]|nr:PAS domain S-box protein [Dehalococcoidales bacterium]